MMKLNIWTKNVCTKVNEIHRYTPDLFYKCHWQRKKGVNPFYLIYRQCVACLFVVICILSFYRPEDRERHKIQYFKWFIYLTNWGFFTCTVQSILGAYITMKRYLELRKKPDLEDEDVKMSRLYKTYWIVHNASVPTAFAITAIYWAAVYDPKIDPLTVMTFLVHGVNSALMFLDILLVAHPFRLADFCYPFFFVVLYIFFSIVYYLTGGTDRLHRRYIYNILNWQYPVKSVMVVSITTAFLFLLHVLTWLLSLYKFHVKPPKVPETLPTHNEVELPPEGATVVDDASATPTKVDQSAD
ncbi:unnamed protein product [Bemisia tabaci]|uniref:Protein rolling stone n=1 Tax=Bemisia tabaci TaxID=7038 RepID=A0A9P0ANA9_BEMTA|nr:PREDICTED: protein rolling stone-like [Bemisia tabaci]XP_018912200.1 PREDICTED: protein rolling stone-like [Bemisia tabaci]CAH0395033.1 unnamed protein product [Bemisia tabaci]